MISAFRRVSLRHFAGHKLRTLLTAVGIALGVAAMIGIRLVNEAASRSFERTTERMAGKAVLQIGNGSAGVPEALVEAVKAVPGVRIAAPSVQGFVPVASLRGERLFVFGIDLLADQEIHDYSSGSSEASIEDPLVFLAQPDSVALTAAFMREHQLAEGGTLEVSAGGRSATLTIRALLDVRSGPATLFADRFAVMDVFAAQRLFGLERRFTQIDIALEQGAGIGPVEARLAEVVGAHGLVERPRTRGESLQKLIEANATTFELGGVLAIIIGLYLILNTMVIAVAERRREIGILRSAGMCRRHVLGLIILEALALGVIGCLLGVPLGYGLARALAGPYIAAISARVFPVVDATIILDPGTVITSVAVGLAAALIAAIVPARDAVRVQPVSALRRQAISEAVPPPYRRSALAGAALLGTSIVFWFFPHALPLSAEAAGIGCQVSLLLALSFLAPTLVRTLALEVERRLGMSSAPMVALASRGLVSQMPRIAITSSALLVSLSGMIALASIITSVERTIARVLDSAFWGVDVAIGSASGIMAQDWMSLPESLAHEIAALPGVARIAVEEWATVPYEGLLTHVVGRDSFRNGVRRLDLIEGDPQEAMEAVERGEAVIVSMVFANRFNKHTGDPVTFKTPSGEATFRIAGVQFDAEDLGMVVVDRSVYRRVWQDDRISFIVPVLEPGADRQKLMDEIRSRWGERYGLFVITIDQLRRENEELVAQSLAAGYPLIAITLTIALLGVVNSLFASVLDRIREIGVLRAVGATRGYVARLVVMEAALIGIAGAIFGVAGGSFLGYVIVGTLFPNVFGIAALFRYPLAAAVFAIVSAILFTAGAGYFPGRGAGRLNVTEALEYE